MKPTLLKNWMMAALLVGACCGMVACDDDDDKGTTPPPTEPDITAVCGEYNGTMAIVEAVPTADETSEEPTGTEIGATVTGDAVEFSDFPIRDLIIKVLGSEETVDEIIAAIGKVNYEIPYTAQLSEGKDFVTMTLEPAALVLTLPAAGGQSEGEETDGTEIEVTIETGKEGTYTLETEKLTFGLSVSGVKLDGTDLPGFEPFTLDFDLAKK